VKKFVQEGTRICGLLQKLRSDLTTVEERERKSRMYSSEEDDGRRGKKSKQSLAAQAFSGKCIL